MATISYIDPSRISPHKAPTFKQLYAIARLSLEALGHEWPESRRDASELIAALQVEPVMRALQNSPEAWHATS